jgi:hypothetical protein
MPVGNVITKAFLHRKFRTKLVKGIRGEAFPYAFTKQLVKAVKLALKSLVETPGHFFNAPPVMEQFLRNCFSRVDSEGQAILTPEDQQYLQRLIFKTSVKILNGDFNPKVMSGPLDCQLTTLVPQKSFIRRHIPINRDDFRSLLVKCGFVGVPAQADWRADDNLAASWYFRVLDFGRMRFGTLDEFLGQRRCFAFLVNTDGHSYTAHFTRPVYERGEDLCPQNITPMDGDQHIFVDPGRRNTFTAMHGLSSAANPAPITTLSTGEYYHICGFNNTAEKRHQKKVADFNDLRFLLEPHLRPVTSIQGIESNLPSPKTTNTNHFITHLRSLSGSFAILLSYYDNDFNKWNRWNYCGRQKGISEVIESIC